MSDWLSQPVCIPWYPCYGRGAFVIPLIALALWLLIQFVVWWWKKENNA